jgi:hypothetical protein
MTDSWSACVWGRAGPSWALHADEVDIRSNIDEDVGGDPAKVMRAIQMCGDQESVI